MPRLAYKGTEQLFPINKATKAAGLSMGPTFLRSRSRYFKKLFDQVYNGFELAKKMNVDLTGLDVIVTKVLKFSPVSKEELEYAFAQLTTILGDIFTQELDSESESVTGIKTDEEEEEEDVKYPPSCFQPVTLAHDSSKCENGRIPAVTSVLKSPVKGEEVQERSDKGEELEETETVDLNETENVHVSSVHEEVTKSENVKKEVVVGALVKEEENIVPPLKEEEAENAQIISSSEPTVSEQSGIEQRFGTAFVKEKVEFAQPLNTSLPYTFEKVDDPQDPSLIGNCTFLDTVGKRIITLFVRKGKEVSRDTYSQV